VRIKFCHQCGYQLARKAKRCPWCKTPCKNNTALLISIFAVLASPVLVAWFLSAELPSVPFSSDPTPLPVVNIVKTKPSLKISRGNFSTLYVRGQVVNLRKGPSLTSHTIGKLRKGQRLNPVSRSGNWLQVLADGSGPGWIHSSLVAKTSTPASIVKAPSERKAFKRFRLSFARYNAKIKKLKGMDFFSNVEYLHRGVIEVTATDILLSAPKRYKEKYLMTLMEMWLEIRESTQPATVRIVDKDGHLRLEEKQG
jgi:SH3 domain-containing protein